MAKVRIIRDYNHNFEINCIFDLSDFHLCVSEMLSSGLAPPDHPSRKIMKKKHPFPKTPEEKISLRINVARRTGRLDLAGEAIRSFSSPGQKSGNLTDTISDMSTDGVSEQLIDRLPGPSDAADVYMTAILQDADGSAVAVVDEVSSLDNPTDSSSIQLNLTSLPPTVFKIKGINNSLITL